MKKIPGWLVGMLVVVGVGAYVALSQGTAVVYESNEHPANEPAVETPAWMQDEDAIKAAEAVVKRKELEAERAELVSEREAIEAEAKAKVDAIKARITEIDKETQAY
jgi:cytochrome c556